jgi:hypothetical protein
MLYAKDRTIASPGGRGECPGCGGDLIAKCGEIVVWHWAHVSGDCDPWSEPETEWHSNWKECFPLECREVTVGNHRADVLIGGHAIEFQHSSISVDEIRERELHYGSLTWVIDGRDFRDRFFVSRPKQDGSQINTKYFRHDQGEWLFNWSHAKKSWFYAEPANTFIDFGHFEYWDRNADYPTLFFITDWSHGGKHGRGRYVCRDWFVRRLMSHGGLTGTDLELQVNYL